MTIKKGDTLYCISTGEPMRVLKTRKRPNNITRLYLAELGSDDIADDEDLRSDDTLVGIGYTATQTPELAQAWAAELAEREQTRQKTQAVAASRRANRTADRDLLNGMASYSGISVLANHYGSRYATFTEAGWREGSDGRAEEYTRTHQVGIYRDSIRNVSEDGDTERVEIPAVNWSSYGSVPVEFARQYAAAILAACDAAETLPTTPTED
jgi:phytoene/squalene synthetase